MMPGLRAVHEAPSRAEALQASTSSMEAIEGASSSSSRKRKPAAASSASKMNGHNHKRKEKQQQIDLGFQLDELPGSLQNATPASTSGINTPATAGSLSGSSTPTRSGSLKRRKKLSATQLRILEKQRQQSNIILAASIAPLAGILLWNYLEPSRAALSTQDTRIPTFHFSSLSDRFLHLSYRLPLSSLAGSSQYTTGQETTPQYLKGVGDFYFVATWVIVWTLFREVLMRFICMPFASWGGIRKNSTLVRFAEQGYDVVTHTASCSFGIYLMQKSEYRNLHLEGMWKGYPHFKLDAGFKAYYLIQCAFWLQQILTLNIEKRRKDYYQMFAHHVITVSLLYLSYTYNFTRVGNVILILMDVCDINLSIAKMLKYFHRDVACDVAFVSFMLMWILTRHVLYMRVLLSAIYDVPNIIEFAWKPEEEHFLTKHVQRGFVALLAALQVLLVIWFFMIIKVLIAVVSGKNAEDSRSDDEDDEESPPPSQAQTPTASPRQQARDRKER